jgi:hypothetical protein
VSLKSASCLVYALDPPKPRQLLLLHPERELGAGVTLRGDEKEPLSVRLRRTGIVTGRLLNSEGQPIGGAFVIAVHSGRAGNELGKQLRNRFDLPRTDAKGQFRLRGIVPGLKFELRIAKGQQGLEPEARLDEKVLEEGKTLDLGDLRMKDAGNR